MRNSFLIPRVMLAAALVALLATPAFAFDPLDPVIEHGSDIWQTPPDGTSFVSFKADPLPRDFFCTGSNPFAGRIVMGGVPLDTVPAGVLGATDTIVQRLDSAVFDENGVAVSRIQLSALQLRSVQPFRTSCGAFTVDVTLADGEQPIGEMRIVRQGPTSGYYEPNVVLNIRVTFTPVDGEGPTLEVVRRLDFPVTRNFWSSQPGEGGVQYHGFVMVDTDADGGADTFVPGTSSNFAPGWIGTTDRSDVLQRGAFSRGGSEAAGSLREASGPVRVVPQSPLRSSAGKLSSTTIGYKACMLGCHCDPDDGTHCSIAVTTLE